MHQFKDLNVWQESVNLVIDVYSLTRKFPIEEKFGLTSQINRAVVSIPSNIAEGAGRNSKPDFNNFLGIALGSSYELETQLIIAQKLNFINDAEILQRMFTRLNSIQRMLNKLKTSLK